MSERRWRLATVSSLGAALLAAALLGAGFAIAVSVAGVEPAAELRSRLLHAFLRWSLFIVPIAALLGGWAGRRLALPFQRLRRSVLEQADGDTSEFPDSRIAEAASLASASGAAASRAGARAASVAGQRDAMAGIVAGASEGLLQVDGAGRVRYANPAARTLLELPGDVAGQSLAALVRNAELRRVVERAVRGEPVRGREVLLRERRLLVSGQPIGGGGGEPPGGAILNVADLTMLRKLEGVRRDFVANASHELKTPLTAIRGYAETLLQDDLDPELRREFLHTVQRNAERLQHIVDDLLDLSRLEAGGWQPAIQPLSLAEAVRDAWQDFAGRAESGGVAFVAPAHDARAFADPAALRQVLCNVFDNALRYTPPGGTIRVEIAAAPAGPDGGARVRLEVSDTGAGIPRAALSRIFERFYRADPARSRVEGGTGLGLSIVKHLAEAMGGGVTADSQLGHGTTIHITLRAAS